MLLSFAACGNSGNTGNETKDNENNEAAPVTEPENGTEDAAKKVLIVYFSPANSDTADAVSMATPKVGNASSTEYIAKLIGEKVDADMAAIVPAEAYPLPYNDAADKAKKEQDNNERPTFTLDVNPEDYDVIIVGYPIWWYHLPMIIRNFFETYDFSGKTIIPYTMHAGSRDGGTWNEIKELEPEASVLDGLAISGERASKAEKSVSDWLKDLGY